MTEAKRPLKVFLCHAHSDKDAVKALYHRLTKDGVDAWLDKEKLLPGQDWELEIRKAVREADVVVVCLSKQFNQAGFRQKEVRLALDTAMEMPEGEIFIIPARLEECDTLESLRKWHWVDLFEDDGYERLMRALRLRADKIGATLQVKKHIKAKKNVSEERVLEAAIERQVIVSKPASLFVWIRRQASKNIISVISSVDENVLLDEDNVKTKNLEVEFPIKNGQTLPAVITLRLFAREFVPSEQQKKINVPPEGDSEVCTFVVTPKREGELLLSLEVLKDEVSLANRNLRTTAIDIEKKVENTLLLVTIPIIVLVQTPISLLENQSLYQRTDGFPAASDYMALEFMLPPTKILDPQKNKLQKWLSQVGLNLNPFEYIDAGKDPLIPFYLIDHDQFDKVSGDQPSFVFAPAGCGKTAFRVRLARECRAGKNGRRIFPIVYKPTRTGSLNDDKEYAARCQRTDLLGYAAQELFLQLAYYPYSLDEMYPALKKAFLQTVSWDLDFSIAYYLNQMKDAGSLEPVINAFDPTARSLPNPPDRDDILYLYKKLNRYIPDTEKPDDEKRIEILFDLILNKLKFEAIYILVDGVDAFLETANSPEQALRTISWLLDDMLNLTKKGIYVKCFLPQEYKSFLTGESAFRLLTSSSKIITIKKWDADALSEVIRQRLQEASGGKFDSLIAISDRALRASGHSPEDVLIADLRRYRKLSPRSLIRAVNWLLTKHVRDERVQEKLTFQDITATREWIRREYSEKERSA